MMETKGVETPKLVSVPMGSKPKTAEEINAAMSKAGTISEADLTELNARDDDVVQANKRTGKPLTLTGEPLKPTKRGDAVASKQGTMDLAKPSPTALKIIRAILAASDVRKKTGAFVKKLLANLSKQMEADKVDYLEVDGVPFRRTKSVDVSIGAFTDWRPAQDSTTALLSLLGVSAEDMEAATDDDAKADAKGEAKEPEPKP